MTQFIGELLGTFILVLLGNGVVCSIALNKTKAQNTGWLMVTLGWAVAVTIAVYASGFLCPAHLNPAVTISLAVIGSFPWAQVVPFIIAQMIGAMAASVLLYLHFYPHFQETEDTGTVLGCFSTAPAIRHTWSNVFGEMLGTAVLMVGILAMGQNKLSDGMSPMIVGLIILTIGFSLGSTTGYAINPARDLGPRLMHAILPLKHKGDSDWGYAWIPIVGPILGGIVGSVLYNMIIQLTM
ncbi:MIP family channel protein [Granulicatella sp. zg-ZJ]|uniref:MIP/aquaporin family protein n=1 Tax=unclassified Granulicatella TaxID=2630493 RepID=UPI0013C11E8C|nr:MULTISPECIES: MIP/aquaporin family protein [unclassified Granulicatella]MBS4751141.1 aquaporin family protein [Carnobacteriaceae bacterium zg-ZUI78]NEW62328.1 MIP family channel protein [Granulicatella sp. zg-ZJ]NEW65533.1 MIP family channel protein [Granulicatella sp. zg-84]QMI86692.1 aquaporin family protein [Carnobacteriaceae bacterium zg-84]